MNHEKLGLIFECYCDVIEYDEQAFVEDAHNLLEMLKAIVESHQRQVARRKPLDAWKKDSDKLLKTLQELDPRMVSHLSRLEDNLYGRVGHYMASGELRPDRRRQRDTNSVLRLMKVLETGVPAHAEGVAPDTQKIHYVSMMLMAGFCTRWGLPVVKTNPSGFFNLMELLMPELDVSWDIYRLADIAIPLQARLKKTK